MIKISKINGRTQLDSAADEFVFEFVVERLKIGERFNLSKTQQLLLLKHSVPAWNRYRNFNTGTAIDLRECDLSGLDLWGANLAHADVSGATFNASILIGADFKFSKISGANFSFADVFQADFTGVNLHDGRGLSERLKQC